MSERAEQQNVQQLPARSPAFRFEAFADAVAAQAAFNAAYPVGSRMEPALQALSAMGAQGRAVNTSLVACRYVENGVALVHRCWYVSLACDRDKAIRAVTIAVAITAI